MSTKKDKIPRFLLKRLRVKIHSHVKMSQQPTEAKTQGEFVKDGEKSGLS